MRLRILKEKDADGMLEWMHDKSINSVFAADFKNFTKEDVCAFIRSTANDETSVHRACVDENDEYLGTVSLKNINSEAKNAEYAVSFRKSAHGIGAAKYATDEILRYGFEELGLKRVYLNVLTDNLRANAFYQKYGFVYEGEFKNHILVNGNLCDLKWYRMLLEEWKERQ